MLTAVFTITPAGSRALEVPSVSPIKPDFDVETKLETRPSKGRINPDDIVSILVSIVPELRKVVVEPERVITASINISTSLIGPIFRSKLFPQNVSAPLLELLYQLTKLPNNQKAWRKELSDAFMDSKFFSSPPGIVLDKWVPLARQYLLADRERFLELLSRLTTPTTAGVLFGVGAASARQEADRRAALNLKRIAFLIFAAESDTFVPKLSDLEDKLFELLSATSATSPSSATRADIFLVLRALVLRTSPVHMSPLWPLINAELHNALVALAPEGDLEKVYNDQGVLQACKLLDTLLVIAPDEFQLHEWLFVTDTIEAVYHPHDWQPSALVDQVVQEMQMGVAVGGKYHHRMQMPWFRGERLKDGEDVRRDVVAPFLRGLSIATYEGTYAMVKPDVAACERWLVADLFEEGI